MLPRQVCVKKWNGIPTLWLDGEPHAKVTYVGPRSHTETALRFPKDGVEIVCVPSALGDAASQLGHDCAAGLWAAPHQLDLTSLYAHLTRVVIAAPHTLVIVKVHLDVPTWWGDLYPNELQVLPDGSKSGQSLASLVWRHQAGGKLTRLIHLIEEGPFVHNVIGYQLAVGYARKGDELQLLDYSVAAQNGFRRWLQSQYATDEELQDAWNVHSVVRESAHLAAYADIAPYWGQPEPPPISRQVVDTCRFYTSSGTDAIAWFSSLVKRASQGKVLAGVYFDRTELAPYDIGGHGMQRVLSSSGIDFICTPECCHGETSEKASFCMSSAVTRHGKLWFCE